MSLCPPQKNTGKTRCSQMGRELNDERLSAQLGAELQKNRGKSD